MDGILCINKPQEMTSFDVVAKVRKLLKVKVGHSGTLDPMATGVLVLAVNQATKALPYLGLNDKTYRGKCKLGMKTSTGDIWGAVEEQASIPQYSREDVLTCFEKLTGPQTQRVPKVSAKKINGKKSYEYVFNDEEVKQLYKDITIYNLELIALEGDEIEFRAFVSNGTYIRTLCEDIGMLLGTLGTMSALEREQVGPYTLENALTLEALTPETKLISVKDTIALPKIVNPRMEDYVKNGKRLKLDIEEDQVLIDTGTYYAVYEREHETTFKSVRGLW